jgi:hypothetical protein
MCQYNKNGKPAYECLGSWECEKRGKNAEDEKLGKPKIIPIKKYDTLEELGIDEETLVKIPRCVARDGIASYYDPENKKFYSSNLRGCGGWYETEMWRKNALIKLMRDERDSFNSYEIDEYIDDIE